MAITVKAAKLWRIEVGNQPGVLAEVLEPLAKAGVDLKSVMGYRLPGAEDKAVIEVYPIVGKKATAAARAAGLVESPIPALILEGDNKPGTGFVVAKAVADAGINLSFLVAEVVGRKYSAVCGFENNEDARKAVSLIKKAATSRKK